MTTTPQALLRFYERAIALIILQCIHELPFPFGIRRTIGVLKGRHAQYILEHELYQVSVFGTLSAWKTNAIAKIIDKLIQNDLLEVEHVSVYGNRPALILTETGERYLAGRLRVSLGFAAEDHEERVQAFLEDMDLFPEDSRLYEQLRDVRYEIASAKQLPLYTICHNKVLRQMARRRPSTVDELYPIPGIGDRFIEQYGARFIEVIIASDVDGLDKSSDESELVLSPYHERLRKIKAAHPRAYEPWCDDEDERLRQLVEEGQTIGQIADFLQSCR
jgi:superfamily II DNA helicase RecQ